MTAALPLTIPALTLTQPWATLVAIGAKQLETRAWRTSYRGWLAIHAAQGYPDAAKAECTRAPFATILYRAGFRDARELPCGVVLAVARLRSCIRTEELPSSVSDQERAFGNYRPGRWAWVLSDVRPLPESIPARGALGLWRWPVPADVAALLDRP